MRLDMMSLPVDCVLQVSYHKNMFYHDSIYNTHALYGYLPEMCCTASDITSYLEVGQSLVG